MARGWVGDAASALRDCDEALRREPRNSKAMHRRVLALQELRQLRVRFQCRVAGAFAHTQVLRPRAPRPGMLCWTC